MATPLPVVPGYDVLRSIGEGGSGVVLEARSTADGAMVALKLVREEIASSARERARILDEARRMQRVVHEGLIALLGVGELPDGRPYLVMPLLRGETLAARLARGPLTPDEAVRTFAVLARAAAALHDAGIVHRDIKPENVILVPGPDGERPVLLDLGIARDEGASATTTTAEGKIRGTPAYMAPERFFGTPANAKSDIYELGVVLYMMLVGRLPWGSEKDVTERLGPRSPREMGADVSHALAALVLRALSTRPEVRPPSARAFAEEAEACLLAAPEPASERRTENLDVTPAPPNVSPERPRPDAPATPRSRRAIFAVTAGVGALAALAFVPFRPQNAHERAPSVASVAAPTSSQARNAPVLFAPAPLPDKAAPSPLPAPPPSPPSPLATTAMPPAPPPSSRAPRRVPAIATGAPSLPAPFAVLPATSAAPSESSTTPPTSRNPAVYYEDRR